LPTYLQTLVKNLIQREIILARLDLEEIYCDVDDFCQIWAQFV